MKYFFSAIFSLALALAIIAPMQVRAQDGFGFGSQLDNVAEESGYDPNNDVSVEERVSNIISIVLSFLGVIFMVLMIVAGFNWMTAGGNEEQVKKATEMIKAAIIGLIIVVSAYAASVFIIERVWGGANQQQQTPPS